MGIQLHLLQIPNMENQLPIILNLATLGVEIQLMDLVLVAEVLFQASLPLSMGPLWPLQLEVAVELR